MEIFLSKYLKKHPLSAWVALFLWLIISVCASYLLFSFFHHQAIQRFSYESRDVANAITERMHDYELALQSGKALFDASDQVTRNDWRQFADTIQLQKYFPGIQALGYCEIVSSESVAKHIQIIRSQGFPNYTVKRTGKHKQYSPIIYIEPFDLRNKLALGFDMFSDSVRQKAMDLAVETNQAATTGRVALAQQAEQAVQYGFLMYIPVYRHNKALSSVDDRERALKGFVFGSFRVDDLMQGILDFGQEQLGFEIYDVGENDGGLLYNNSASEQSVLSDGADYKRFKQTYDLNVAGRPWQLIVYSHPDFLTLSERYLPIFIVIIFSLFGGFLFYFISFLSRERGYAHREAVKANQQKKAITQHLQLAANAANLGLMEWDLHTDKVYLDKRMLSIYGLKPDKFHGSYTEWQQTLHPDDRERVLMSLAKASQFEERFELAFRIIVNNDIRYIHSSFSVERDAIDNPLSIIGFSADVTERHDVDVQLREKNWRIESLLEGANLGSWEWNIQTGDAIYNERWAEMIGYKLSELMPTTIDTWKKYCHPDDSLAAEEQLQQHFKGETDYFEMTIRMRRRNGSWKYIFSRGKLFSRTDEGLPLLMFGTSQDITEQ
ncbi:CHASE domain-containing protein [Methylophaga sulfidovorans]|uniref:histidine kinase n=1 Tax=Methylophaga sulfidovorans TaxID=45496 RepID=A0A1I4A2I9_9GAMM|nr:CHASE domain-containing protein [Methylophaga sulfidovorans]SFK50574.1 PAS domain S-box-containing protein [Methylophaga sulfidovorans]